MDGWTDEQINGWMDGWQLNVTFPLTNDSRHLRTTVMSCYTIPPKHSINFGETTAFINITNKFRDTNIKAKSAVTTAFGMVKPALTE